jgi:hypothetical protein
MAGTGFIIPRPGGEPDGQFLPQEPKQINSKENLLVIYTSQSQKMRPKTGAGILTGLKGVKRA